MLWAAWVVAATITVPVITQLHESQRNLLPDKTIEASFKTLDYGKNANSQLTTCIDSLMQIVVDNAYQCRTFELNVCNLNDEIITSITYLDPTTKDENQKKLMGAFIKEGRHFLVTCDSKNEKLIKTLFVDGRDKVKYVREFEMVEDLIPQPETLVNALITQNKIKITHCMVEGEDLTASE